MCISLGFQSNIYTYIYIYIYIYAGLLIIDATDKIYAPIIKIKWQTHLPTNNLFKLVPNVPNIRKVTQYISKPSVWMFCSGKQNYHDGRS
jgi:hypothetical protein